jgi:hypothetical protein
MSQYKIPQDVGIADKIVGPLTLRQLIIIAVGGGASYVLFAVAGKLYELNILEYIVIALPALIALAAALIKINNIPFTQFILLSLEYAIKPKKRLWNHSGISAIVAPNLIETKIEAKSVAEESTKQNVNLDELSQILDSGGFEHVKEIKHEDIDKVKDDDLMTEAYFGHKKNDSETENMYWRTTDSHKKRLDMLAKIPAIKPRKQPARTDTGGEIKIIEKPKTGQVITSQPIMKAKTVTSETGIKPESRPPIHTEAEKNPVLPARTPFETTGGGPVRKNTGIFPRPPEPVQAGAGRQAEPRIIPQTEKKPQLISKQAGQTNVLQPKKTEQQSQQPEQGKPFEKKKRHRKKKSKFAQPVRPGTQIDNTQKKQPMKLMPKQFTQPPGPTIENRKTPPAPGQQGAKGGEISFKELEKGTIEFNLD